MQQKNARWQELARLESLAERYHCADGDETHWLCGVLRDAIEWNRKSLMRAERLGMDSQHARQDLPERLEAP